MLVLLTRRAMLLQQLSPMSFLGAFPSPKTDSHQAHTLLTGNAVRRLFTSTCFLVQRIYWAAQGSSDYQGPVASVCLESFAEYAGKEATVRTRHGMMDWFKIGKGVHQGCILSPCLYKQSVCMLLCLVTQSCPTLCDPMDCSPPGSPVPGILQAIRRLKICKISQEKN